jgi:hypothetical protein
MVIEDEHEKTLEPFELTKDILRVVFLLISSNAHNT